MSGSKKSIFNKLKDTFVEDVPESTPHVSTLPTAKSVMAEVGSFGGTSAPASNEPDPQALAKLEETLTGALPPLYAHFMEQLESLKEVISDEGTRIKAALKTSKASADQVVGSLDQLIGVMDHAASDFAKSFEEKKTKLEAQVAEAIKTTEDLIKTKEEQLKSIEEQLIALKAKRDSDAQGLQAEEKHLEGVRSGFYAAHQQVLNRLTMQKTKIAAVPKGS
jgi:ABC-type transporter Mla subunit MlaD